MNQASTILQKKVAYGIVQLSHGSENSMTIVSPAHKQAQSVLSSIYFLAVLRLGSFCLCSNIQRNLYKQTLDNFSNWLSVFRASDVLCEKGRRS